MEEYKIYVAYKENLFGGEIRLISHNEDLHNSFPTITVRAESQNQALQKVSSDFAFLLENISNIKHLINLSSQLSSLCDDNK
jgi:hypothetical protein